MEMTESFLILGLEPVKDERLIKNAYREKLAVTNPEDDPEGFKRLRTAYDEACAYARRGDEDENQSERDTTPSGLWVERAEDIYSNIVSRQKTELWRELFEDDIFQSLEEEENCRFKFLRFVMDHFRFPSEVWKVFDEKLNLVQDAGALREKFPADFINYVVNRCERGEDIDFDCFEGADDADYDLFINYYDNSWQALQAENIDEAEKLLKEAEGLHIYHPVMEVCKGRLLYEQGKHNEAAEFMKALQKKHPKDIMVSYNTAEMLWRSEENRDDAAQIYLGLKADNDKHYMANVRLSEWYYSNGDYKEAKKCAESVLSSGADDSFMEILAKINSELEKDLEKSWHDNKDWEAALELCWCYLQDGKTSRGIRLATSIEKSISKEKEAEYYGLLSKLFVEEAEYDDAINMSRVWEKRLQDALDNNECSDEEEIEKNKDRIRQAHMIRMQSYRNLGYKDKTNFEKAIKEIEEVETGTPKDIGLWLEKAQIYMELEEYDKSLELTSRMIEEYQVYAAAATAMEVYRRQWDAGGVAQNARLCIQSFPGYVRAYDHLGRVYLDLEQIEDLKALLEEAEKNSVESPYLEAYRYQIKKKPPVVEVLNRNLDRFQREFHDKLDEGQNAYYEMGLPIITEYLYCFPGAYMLRRRASFHKSGMQLDKAMEDYEKALVEEPGNPYIYNSMCNVHVLKGNYEQALVCMKKAILYGDAEWVGVLYYYMAKIYMLLGDNEQALVWFKYYDEHSENETGHLRNMAECLARLGRVDEAVEKLAGYYRKGDGAFYDGYYQSLVHIYMSAGQPDKVRQILEVWDKKKLVKKNSRFFTLMLINSIPQSIRNKIINDDSLSYYNSAAWRAMQDGDGKKALYLLEIQVKLGECRDGSGSKEGLEDIIFAAILFGNDKIGKKYASKLKIWMNRESLKSTDEYFTRPKGRLTQTFLANYYLLSDDKLQEILDKEKNCAICDFCLMPLCQELEGMRILLLLRQGRRDEAKARLEHNLEVQPFDEYMQAIAAVLV